MGGASSYASGNNALLGAAQWVEGFLHGQLATLIAILAVAAVGLSLLTGRMAMRRAATVVIGCFLLFGASAIARGIVGIALGNSSSGPITVEPVAAPSPRMEAPTPPQSNGVADPYAGASVPR